MTLSFQEILRQAKETASLESNFQPQNNHPQTAPLPNPRVLYLRDGQPSITTNNRIFDVLYALAVIEMEEDAVSEIKDQSFNNNQPIDCRPDGCFQAGAKWNYVWTRDTSYAVHLAFAALKPKTALKSLKFKTSDLRSKLGKKTNKQIVQDTGTGGSYPISSDRVVWALGAAKLLHYLSGEERQNFQQEAFEIIKNTINHDRQVVFDKIDGLYYGEQSFLDWREQTYPAWVAEDVIHVGMSKSLSTNLLHLSILELAADLAQKVAPSDCPKRKSYLICLHSIWSGHKRLNRRFAIAFI